jgi:hypothetical protein
VKRKIRPTYKEPEACQHQLARSLNTLCRSLRKEYPGVWSSPTLDSLENAANELDKLCEQGVFPRIVLYWQPPLLPPAEQPGEKSHARSR